jgi:hypothetical protein
MLQQAPLPRQSESTATTDAITAINQGVDDMCLSDDDVDVIDDVEHYGLTPEMDYFMKDVLCAHTKPLVACWIERIVGGVITTSNFCDTSVKINSATSTKLNSLQLERQQRALEHCFHTFWKLITKSEHPKHALQVTGTVQLCAAACMRYIVVYLYIHMSFDCFTLVSY